MDTLDSILKVAGYLIDLGDRRVARLKDRHTQLWKPMADELEVLHSGYIRLFRDVEDGLPRFPSDWTDASRAIDEVERAFDRGRGELWAKRQRFRALVETLLTNASGCDSEEREFCAQCASYVFPRDRQSMDQGRRPNGPITYYEMHSTALLHRALLYWTDGGHGQCWPRADSDAGDFLFGNETAAWLGGGRANRRKFRVIVEPEGLLDLARGHRGAAERAWSNVSAAYSTLQVRALLTE